MPPLVTRQLATSDDKYSSECLNQRFNATPPVDGNMCNLVTNQIMKLLGARLHLGPGVLRRGSVFRPQSRPNSLLSRPALFVV